MRKTLTEAERLIIQQQALSVLRKAGLHTDSDVYISEGLICRGIKRNFDAYADSAHGNKLYKQDMQGVLDPLVSLELVERITANGSRVYRANLSRSQEIDKYLEGFTAFSV